MQKFGRAQPVRRFEDVRFVTGRGNYIDDDAPKDAAHAVFVRSQVAHGRILSVDTEAARGMPGVLAVLTADDVPDYAIDATLVKNRDGSEGADPRRKLLARDRVRFVGEPVACVVAATLAEARDAAEAILVETEALPVHTRMARAEEGALHDEAPGNLAFDWGLGDWDDVGARIEAAAHVVRTRVEDHRIVVNAMEPRGAWAEWSDGRLHLAFGGQGVWGTRDALAECFGLDEDAVRVTTPDVGGGFGMKGADYPEYFVIAAAARAAGRPVRWTAERSESMLSDNGGRGLVTETELAFDADHRLIAYRADTDCDLGAWNSQFTQMIQSELFAKVAQGTYDMEAIALRSRGWYTNTAQTDAYRGAGRPEAIYALERSMDNAARTLGVDPFELRRRNFIPPDRMPYKTHLAETYDVGDFARVLDRLADVADHEGFAARREADEAQGLLRGRGLCYYIESILGEKKEDARVVFDADGGATLYVGTQSNGQGHETVYATFLSDQTGIPVDRIRIVQGDSALIGWGGGTGGSRSVTMQSVATLSVVSTIVKRFSDYLAEKFDSDDVAFDDERFRVGGSNETPTMLEVARMAREDGREDLLEFNERGRVESRSFPNGAHMAEVVIDPETGLTRVDRYAVADDFGNMINPMLAEGQVHGGVAQGIGQAITERTVYDDDGQLLTATFMDYAMPRAYDVPFIRFVTEPVPSTNNPMGMKGCGEAGTVGALAAVANAVHDALAPRGVTEVQMPFTPERVWNALRQANAPAG